MQVQLKQSQLMPQRIWQLLTMTFTIWSEAKSSRMSAAMTYYTMLSLAPMLMIAIAVATQVYCSDKVKDEIMDYTRDVASPQVAQTVAGLLANTTAPKSGLIAGSISLAILLYGASGIFSQLFDTFNDIWKVPVQMRSGIRFSIRNRLLGVVMVLMVGGLLISTLAISSVIAYVNQLLDGNYPRLTSWLSLTDRGLSFVLMPFVLSLMFWYFPARRMKWMDVWPAAGITAGLLSASRYLIDLYLSVSTSSEVYGAAGSLVMLLVWVYLTGMILFFGAAFSCAWTKLFGSHSQLQAEDQALDQSLLKGIRISLRTDAGLPWKSSAWIRNLGARDSSGISATASSGISTTSDPDVQLLNRPASSMEHPAALNPRDIGQADRYNQPPGTKVSDVAEVENSDSAESDRLPLTPQRRQRSAFIAAEAPMDRPEPDRARLEQQIHLRRRSA